MTRWREQTVETVLVYVLKLYEVVQGLNCEIWSIYQSP